MQLVGYLRVSTDRQAEEGLGLEVQQHAIETWAATHAHVIVAWCRDEGVSGSNGLDARVGLADALEALRSHAVEGLVVYRLDRLARDLVLQEQLLADVRRLGGDVFSTSNAECAYLVDDPDDPSRRLIRQVLGAVSEYERGMITLRLRAGRHRKASNGGYAYGAPGYGYSADARALVPVNGEQSAIRRIEALRDAGFSLRQIVAVLQHDGIPTKRGGRWHPKVVSSILARSQT